VLQSGASAADDCETQRPVWLAFFFKERCQFGRRFLGDADQALITDLITDIRCFDGHGAVKALRSRRGSPRARTHANTSRAIISRRASTSGKLINYILSQDRSSCTGYGLLSLSDCTTRCHQRITRARICFTFRAAPHRCRTDASELDCELHCWSHSDSAYALIPGTAPSPGRTGIPAPCHSRERVTTGLEE